MKTYICSQCGLRIDVQDYMVMANSPHMGCKSGGVWNKDLTIEAKLSIANERIKELRALLNEVQNYLDAFDDEDIYDRIVAVLRK